MSTLTTVPKGTTLFKPYIKPRFSQAKKHIFGTCDKRVREICKNCHQPRAFHEGACCPEYQILNK